MSASLKRLSPILLVAVATGIVVGYLANYAISNGKIKELEDKLSALTQKYKDLQEELSSLQGKHKSLESKYNILKSDYESIMEERNALQSQVEYYKGLIEEAGVVGLTLSQILFCDSEPPNASIKEPPEYLPGEEVWLYVELRGFKTKKVEDGYAVNVDWHLHVFDEFGAKLLDYGPLNIHEVHDSKPSVLWFKAKVTMRIPGAYIAIVTAYDRLSLRTISTANVFFIASTEA